MTTTISSVAIDRHASNPVLSDYEFHILGELFGNIATGAMYTEASLCVHSERVVAALGMYCRRWRRGVGLVFANRRLQESDLPDTDLLVLEEHADLIDSGAVFTRQEANSLEVDPQLWLHLADYAPLWRSRQQGPAGADLYYAMNPIRDDCVNISHPPR